MDKKPLIKTFFFYQQCHISHLGSLVGITQIILHDIFTFLKLMCLATGGRHFWPRSGDDRSACTPELSHWTWMDLNTFIALRYVSVAGKHPLLWKPSEKSFFFVNWHDVASAKVESGGLLSWQNAKPLQFQRRKVVMTSGQCNAGCHERSGALALPP